MTDHNYDAKTNPGDAAEVKLEQESGVKARLELSGGVYNFLPHDLIIADAKLQKRTTFPREAEVQIKWVPKEYSAKYHQSSLHDERPCDESWRADLVSVEERHLTIDADPEVIGALNGVFDLVAPLRSAAELLDFWRGARALQYAHLEGLPDLKELRKYKPQGMMPYFVMSRGMAMLAYLSYQEMDNVLLPAMPVQLSGTGEIAYRALMPMRLVLAGLKQ